MSCESTNAAFTVHTALLCPTVSVFCMSIDFFLTFSSQISGENFAESEIRFCEIFVLNRELQSIPTYFICLLKVT